MKKSIKLLAMGMAVVPCALVLTACGGNNDTSLVDTKGDYSVVETTNYSEVLTDLDNKGFDLETIFNGTRLVMDLNGELDVMGQKMSINANSDTIVKCLPKEGTIDANDYAMISKNAVELSATSDAGNVNLNATVNQYAKDGVQYIDLTGAEDLFTMSGYQLPALKMYNNLATGNVEDDVVPVPEFSVVDLLSMIPEINLGNDFVIEKYETENDYKVKMTMKGAFVQSMISAAIQQEAGDDTTGALTLLQNATINSMSDVVIYIVYSNGSFAGTNISANVDLTMAMPVDETTSLNFGLKLDFNFDVIGYTGSFDFPTDLNTTNYVEMPEWE